MAVDEFVKHAGLWLGSPAGDPRLLVSRGELTLDILAEYDEIPPGHLLYLNLVDQSLSGPEFQAWKNRRRAPFDASGRLARVPLVFRLGGIEGLSLERRGQPSGAVLGPVVGVPRAIRRGARDRNRRTGGEMTDARDVRAELLDGTLVTEAGPTGATVLDRAECFTLLELSGAAAMTRSEIGQTRGGSHGDYRG